MNLLWKARDQENFNEMKALSSLLKNVYFPKLHHLHVFGDLLLMEEFKRDNDLAFIDKQLNAYYIQIPKECVMLEEIMNLRSESTWNRNFPLNYSSFMLSTYLKPT